MAPLLTKLNNQDADFRLAVVEEWLRLGDKQTVVPMLLTMLDDQETDVRLAVIEALGKRGDKRAVGPLVAKLDDKDVDLCASTAVALHVLGELQGILALTQFLASNDFESRQAAVRAYARQQEFADQRLLSLDLAGTEPWIDPKAVVTEARVTQAASRLSIPSDQVRSRYESIARDLNLKLGWLL